MGFSLTKTIQLWGYPQFRKPPSEDLLMSPMDLWINRSPSVPSCSIGSIDPTWSPLNPPLRTDVVQKHPDCSQDLWAVRRSWKRWCLSREKKHGKTPTEMILHDFTWGIWWLTNEFYIVLLVLLKKLDKATPWDLVGSLCKCSADSERSLISRELWDGHHLWETITLLGQKLMSGRCAL